MEVGINGHWHQSLQQPISSLYACGIWVPSMLIMGRQLRSPRWMDRRTNKHFRIGSNLSKGRHQNARQTRVPGFSWHSASMNWCNMLNDVAKSPNRLAIAFWPTKPSCKYTNTSPWSRQLGLILQQLRLPLSLWVMALSCCLCMTSNYWWSLFIIAFMQVCGCLYI